MYTPIATKEKITNRYIPIAEKKPQKELPPISLTDFSFQTQTSTPSFLPKGTPTIQSMVGGFAKDAGQSIARNVASAGLTISTAILPKKLKPYSGSLRTQDFRSYFGQALFETIFGKGEEIKTIEDRIAEAEPKIEKWKKEMAEVSKTPGLNPVEKTITKILANLHTSTIAFGGIMGSVGLDLTPFGGLEKNVYKAIIKEGTEEGAELLLKNIGVADDLAKNFAKDVVKVSTEKEAKALFNNMVKLQSTTKFGRAYIPIAERVATKEIPKEKVFLPMTKNAKEIFENIKGRLEKETMTPTESGMEFVKVEPTQEKLNQVIIDAEKFAKNQGRKEITGVDILESLGFHTLKEFPPKGSKMYEYYEQAGVISKTISPREKIIIELPIKRPPTAKKILGIEPPAKIIKTEMQLLKGQIRAEARTAKEVAKEVKKITKEDILTKLRVSTEASQEIKNNITDFVKEKLSSADRGKALVMVRDAKTPRDLTKSFARIYRWADDAEKTAIRNDILKTQKKIMDSPSIAIDYKARVKELMGDFELKGHREETLERLKKTQEFLQSEIAKGNDVEIPRRVLKSLELLNRTPFEQITRSQLGGLRTEMELLEEIGKAKFRTAESVWEIQKTKILSEIKTQGAKPINNIELIKPEIGERLTLTQKFKNFIWKASNEAGRIDKAISPMDTIFDLLDGGKGTYNGANFRYFKGQVDSGYGRYLTRKDILQNPVIELSTKYGLDDMNFERIGVVAAKEQDGGIEKLIASGFTKEQIDAVKLSSQEQEILNLMRSTFDSQFPEIKDVMRRVYNQPVEKVKNYFSFMTDWKAMDETEVFQRFGSQLPEQYGAPRKNVEVGFTKTRVGGEQKIKINALDVFLQHTDNTSYLLELGETSKLLGEIASSPQYAEMVGDVGQLMVREWLDVIARKGGASGASEIAILNTLRKNVGIGILGMKLSTIAIQPTALIDGMGFIGAKYGIIGTKNFATSAEWRKFVMKMPEIKDRMGGEFALRELTDDNWLQNIQRKGFIPMQTLDQYTAGSIAAGAYEKKMIELGLPFNLTEPFNKEALEYAQLAVRRTQSSGQFKDVPLVISRGALTGNRSLDRAIFQFQNFLLTRWSRIRHDAIRVGINEKDPKKAVPILTAIIFSALAASGIRLGVNKVQDFITGKEDKDTATEDLAKGFMYEMTGNVPFLGTTVSMAMYDGEMFPILDAPKGVISGLNRVITSESETAKLRGFTEFAGSTGALLGIPGSAQAEQMIRGALQEKTKSKGILPQLPKMQKLPKLPSLPALIK